jgi:type I restriction enzyme S subunit
MSKLPICEAADFINGRAFKPSEWGTEGLPIIRIQNLTGSNETFNFFNGTIDPRNVVKRGDILISWSASLGVYRWTRNDAALNQHIFKVVLKPEVVPSYFYYVATNALNQMVAQVHGSTMQHITKDKFDAIPIVLPSESEQKRIAAILEKADRLRRTRRYARQLGNTFLQSVFLEMFGDPVKNPRNWDIEQFSAIGTLDRGRSKHRPRNAPHLYGGKYPFIQTGDIANCANYIRSHQQNYSEQGLKQSKLWPQGTLCITIAANIAKTGILTYPACFPDSVVGFLPSDVVVTEYVQYWLSFLQTILERTAPESAQKNINLEILRNLRTPVPPLPLQQKFAAIARRFEHLRAQHREAERQAEHLFQTLLHRAFSSGL